MLTNDVNEGKKAKKKWTRSQARGILTSLEREILQGKYNGATYDKRLDWRLRYFTSHILRKARKGIEDLKLIFKYYSAKDLLSEGYMDAKRIIAEVVEYQYTSNHVREVRNYMKRNIDFHTIDENVIIKQTREQLVELINQALKEIA